MTEIFDETVSTISSDPFVIDWTWRPGRPADRGRELTPMPCSSGMMSKASHGDGQRRRMLDVAGEGRCQSVKTRIIMPIDVVCTCGRSSSVPDQYAGKKGKCPACGAVIDIPVVDQD